MQQKQIACIQWFKSWRLRIVFFCSVLQCVAVCCRVLRCVSLCCRVLPCVAVCCRVLPCAAVCCSVLQSVALTFENVEQCFCCTTRACLLQLVAACSFMLQRVAACCSVLQRVAACCSDFWERWVVLLLFHASNRIPKRTNANWKVHILNTATHFSKLQHTATHYNTLQRTATCSAFHKKFVSSFKQKNQ